MSRRNRMPRPKGYHWDAAEPFIHPENGRKSCRWCRGRVDPPRRTFCGNPWCVYEWTRRTQWKITRRDAYERSRKTCAACRLNLAEIDANRATHQAYLSWRHALDPRFHDSAMVLNELAEPYPVEHWIDRHRLAVAFHAANKIPMDREPWEVDHIVPVSMGGDFFDWSNLQILCRPCHKIKTRSDTASRARARREAAIFSAGERRNGRKPLGRRVG